MPGLTINIVASSGTTYVAYLGYGYEEQTEPGSWDASLGFDGPTLATIEFFRPYTTTMIRLYIERQVMPLDPQQPASLLIWDLLRSQRDTDGVVSRRGSRRRPFRRSCRPRWR